MRSAWHRLDHQRASVTCPGSLGCLAPGVRPLPWGVSGVHVIQWGSRGSGRASFKGVMAGTWGRCLLSAGWAAAASCMYASIVRRQRVRGCICCSSALPIAVPHQRFFTALFAHVRKVLADRLCRVTLVTCTEWVDGPTVNNAGCLVCKYNIHHTAAATQTAVPQVVMIASSTGPLPTSPSF